MTIETKVNQGSLFKSCDGEYVYNIFSYTPNHPDMIVDILKGDTLETITSKTWTVSSFLEQVASGSIVEY